MCDEMPLRWWFREHAMHKAEYARDVKDRAERGNLRTYEEGGRITKDELVLYNHLFGRGPQEW